MNTFRKIFPIILFSIFVCKINAQNDYARVTAGINAAKPFFKDGYKAEEWNGFHARSKFLEYGFATGNVNLPGDVSARGNYWYVGANFPLMKLKYGNRQYGVKGFLFVPFVATDIGKINNGVNSSFQLTIAPGASLQLPFTAIDFRLNTIIGFKSAEGLSHVTFMPTAAFQLDALWDVLDPVLQFDGTRYHQYNSYEEKTDVEHHLDYDIITTTETTTYHAFSTDVYQYNVGPYIALGPRATYTKHPWTGKTEMLGIDQSGRSRGLSYDIIAETGKIGFASSYVDTSTFSNPRPQGKFNKTDDQFIGEASCIRGFVRLGFDLNKSMKHANQFTRFMCGVGIGYAHISNPHFTNEGADEKFNAYYVNQPNVLLNDHTDMRKSRDGMFVNLFFSYEVGVIAISYEKNIYKNASLANAGTLSITYNFPFEKVYDTYQKIRFEQKH